MTFQLPDLTPLIVSMIAVMAVTAMLIVGVVVAFFAQNRKVRVARREPLFSYYGRLAHSH